jgi:hypothetical protein
MVKRNRIAYDGIRNRIGYVMAEGTEDAWDSRVKGILKAELKRKGVTYAQLVDRLSEIGVKETEPNIRNKLARGKFKAMFFVQCLSAIGCKSISIGN